MSVVRSKPDATRRAVPPRAFSLIELVVVVIMLGIFAGVTLPRLVGGRARQGELEAKRVAGLLTALAQREALSGRAVALSYNAAAAELAVLVRVEATGVGTDAPTTGGWVSPPLLTPVRLSTLQLSRLLVDGAAYPSGSFRVEVPGGRVRPMLDVLLELNGAQAGERSAAWQATLDPSRPGASVRALGDSGAFNATVPESIDLDAAGRRTNSW